MNVLVLGLTPSPLKPILQNQDCNVIEYGERIDEDIILSKSVDYAISYRYRFIIPQKIINLLKGNIINLHISFLPWNRGADPNLWSFLENTPKGVTIHYIDEGIDTGDIITRKEIFFNLESDTLATTYQTLNREILNLFESIWPDIIHGNIQRKKQPQGGSFHKTKDIIKYVHLISEKGWDTPIKEIIGIAAENPGTT